MYIADLHIHSRFSMATSKDGILEMLDLWARRKGIHLVGTGDFTHPVWRQELMEKLEPAEEGLYVLKKEYRIDAFGKFDHFLPRFVVSGEISNIYKKDGKTRKVHSLVLLPGLDAAQRIAEELEWVGNLHSDGRPILGISCKELLERVMRQCPDAMYIPAHIWTPHFSLFGAASGFDSVEACFEELSGQIHALETGLSSDPPMNRRISALDSYQLISNSDAHSPAKLGREATLLDISSEELAYQSLYDAIQYGKGLKGTIEFFPEEGKYFMDGHRKCGVCMKPEVTEAIGGICPVCGKRLTMGVLHRTGQLADRKKEMPDCTGYFESLIPLPELVGEAMGYSSSSKRVQAKYMELLEKLGTEFEILREIPVEEIEKQAGTVIAEGIDRLRAGKTVKVPGFDGEYGKIQVLHKE